MKRVRVKMLRRHCSLIPGQLCNLVPGEEVDKLLRSGIAVLIVPVHADMETPEGPKPKKRGRPRKIGPSETK